MRSTNALERPSKCFLQTECSQGRSAHTALGGFIGHASPAACRNAPLPVHFQPATPPFAMHCRAAAISHHSGEGSQHVRPTAECAGPASLRSCPRECIPDWRAVAELFRAATRAEPRRTPKAPKPKHPEIADYNIDGVRLKCRSPRIAVRFLDGEAVFTHVPSAPGKPLNVGRALRVAIAMYRSRRTVQQRYGFHEYDRAMPVLEIFQVRCLETDELFEPAACNAHTAGERASSDPERAAAMLPVRT